MYEEILERIKQNLSLCEPKEIDCNFFVHPHHKYCNYKSGNSLKNNCGYKGSVCCGLSKADKKGPVNAWNELINYKKLAFKRGREFEDKRVCSKIQTNTKKSIKVLEFRRSLNPLLQ